LPFQVSLFAGLWIFLPILFGGLPALFRVHFLIIS
jgi:hypothetical protein